MPEQLWILALRRGVEAAASLDWQATVKEWPGVRVVGASERRMQIEAAEPVVDELRAFLGTDCLIEKAVEHSYRRQDR